MRTLATVCLAATLSSQPALAAVTKGMRAPDFALPSLRGPKVSLASLRGKVVLIDFWAQWCEPCKKELPQLERLSKEFASRGVVVLTVNIDKQRDNAERLAHQLGLTMDVLLDPAGQIAGTYDLPKMPSSFLVDKKGFIRFIHEGFEGDGDVSRFRSELEQLSR